MVLPLLRLDATIHVICDHIGCEGDEGDAEAGEEVGEHCTIGEDGMLSPGVALGPWVAEKRRWGHDYCCRRLGISEGDWTNVLLTPAALARMLVIVASARWRGCLRA